MKPFEILDLKGKGMNVAKHARARWAQRIDMPPEYEHITKEVLEALDGSEFIWEDEKGASFFINKEYIIFLVDLKDNTVITLYPVDYGLPEDINEDITFSLIEKLIKKSREIENLEDEQWENRAEINKERDLIENDIKQLERQIQFLRSELNTLNAEEEKLDRQLDAKQGEYQNLAYQLTYSKSYKIDKLKK